MERPGERGCHRCPTLQSLWKIPSLQLFKRCSGWSWREFISDMNNCLFLDCDALKKMVDTQITGWTLSSNHQSSNAVKSILVNSGTHPRLETISTPNPTHWELNWTGQIYFILKTTCKYCSVCSKHSLPSGKLSKRRLRMTTLELQKILQCKRRGTHACVLKKKLLPEIK